MRLPGWLRAALGGAADGVLDLRQSGDRATLHALAYVTTLPDVGDMVTVWEHRTVDLRRGWVDAVRYARASDDADREAAIGAFWDHVQRQQTTPLLPFGPAPVAWALCDPHQSDTQKAPRDALRSGVRVYRNERMHDGTVELVRDGQVVARHRLTGATGLGEDAARSLWLGEGPRPGQVVIVAGALRPSVLVLDVPTGGRALHARI